MNSCVEGVYGKDRVATPPAIVHPNTVARTIILVRVMGMPPLGPSSARRAGGERRGAPRLMELRAVWLVRST